MEKKGSIKNVLLLTAAVLLVIVIARVLLGLGVGFSQRQHDKWTEEMDAAGPWSEEAVWATEDGSAWLQAVLRDTDAGDAVTVTAYFRDGEQWLSGELHRKYGVKKCIVQSPSGSDLLEAGAKLKDGRFVLFAVQTYSAGPKLSTDKLVFEKQESGAALPFETE